MLKITARLLFLLLDGGVLLSVREHLLANLELANVASFTLVKADGLVSTERLHLTSDRHGLDGGVVGDGEDVSYKLSGSGSFGSSRITSLGLLVALAGEDNELGLVGLEALNVGLETFNRKVGAAVVNGNADGAGQVLVDASFL